MEQQVCGCFLFEFFFFFFKQKTAYEMQRGLVGSEMCIRDRRRVHGAEAASRAALLVGENTHQYSECNVLNYAIFGYPYLHNHNVTFYTNFGSKIESAKVGAVIVGSNHAAIVTSSGDSFIHAHEDHHDGHIVESKLSDIKTYFPNGYVFREYICKEAYQPT
eukprot:TRINITY_DN6089_c0_g1_i8.p1 TRINITY_DN6089_c0_g1~~TRINITY_DN6089_c0_g1_i8.p1  ORF type:complete len:162 (-),score=30.25 TRINITY_DN6089_c0_g1_i8:34-519(-)